MMKKALAVGAFALVMALPLVSSAGSILSTFAGSTSGTSIIGVGDTISFDVFLTLDTGVNYTGLSFSLTGDEIGGLASSSPGWAGVANNVTNWAWNFNSYYTTQVDFTGDLGAGFAIPQNNTVFVPPLPVMHGQVVIAPLVGAGNSMLVGTVTVQAGPTFGTFGGGGIMHNQPVTDSWQTAAGADPVSFSTVSFTVIPEPGTALLMVLGLGGLGVMGRKNRD
jgi:hypothetical protein